MATAVHAHDEAPHHPGPLQYQPGLPIPLGKTIVWLFLSTEIMFFAGLIGTYIVLRFGAPTWPQTHEVHLSEPIGAFNTFVLICSSVTVVLALEAARANKAAQAKMFTFITLVLGLRVFGREGLRIQREVFARTLSVDAAQPDVRKGEPGIWLGGSAAADGRGRSTGGR